MRRLQRQEEIIYEKRLATNDSLQARLERDAIRNKYRTLEEKLRDPSFVTSPDIRLYISRLDSLNSVFKFLDQNDITANLKEALSKIETLNDKFQQAQKIKDFIRERREVLQREFERLGLVKQLKQFNKEFYYYGEQIKEYEFD